VGAQFPLRPGGPTRALRYDTFAGQPRVAEVPDPTPSPDGVVVKVEASGLCRSDWHGWMGHDPDITLPHVPGHELAGVVVATGDRVTRWQTGDPVTVPFVCGCGSCEQCVSGNPQVCERQFQPGFTAWGSFAEYVELRHADVNLVRLPDGMDAVAAASLGCRFSTAFRAVLAQGRVSGGQWVAVHGCGGVGLSAVMIAAAVGARVIAVDVSAAALDRARSLGAVAAVDGTAVDDPADAVRTLSGGGVHVSLDALGSPQTCAGSIRCLRTRGRHVQVGLLPSALGPAAVPMDLVIARELEVVGSHGMAAHAFPRLLAMVEAGALDPARLVRRTITLDEAGGALMALGDAATAGVTVINRFR
jgi:D-arabinose 1-dehydrogenase-like Zn-dependent alcohol dehydrogenase